MSNGHSFPEWINLYGEDLTVNGNLLPVDTAIRAFNQEGGLVGESILRFNPRTGGNLLKFMPVYKAPGPVEGMPGVPVGEAFLLVINGHEVRPGVEWSITNVRLIYQSQFEFGHRIELSSLVTPYLPGDANNDGTVNGADISILAAALWMGRGWDKINMDASDVDGTGGVNNADLTRLIDFVYKGGPPPVWFPVNMG